MLICWSNFCITLSLGLGRLSEADIEEISPSAAAAGRLLKSGLSLTQIYSEYVDTSEALHLEKEENKRLNEYVDQILQVM